MNVALLSCFRNSLSKGHLPRYYAQAAKLAGALAAQGDTLIVIASEGDSRDATLEQLLVFQENAPFPVVIANGSHGGPEMGSVVHPQRMRQFAHAANAALDQVDESIDAVIYVESDLIWDHETMITLLRRLQVPGVDIVSPPTFAGSAFYDIWGYRKNGKEFNPFPPYHAQLDPSCLTEMDSVGSCIAVRGEVARACRMQPEDAIVGFCRVARERGWRVWTDWQLSIRHPA